MAEDGKAIVALNTGRDRDQDGHACER